MSFFWIRPILLICAVTWSISSAWSMDLLEIYLNALEQNPNILAARAITDAERERIPQARAQLLPNLSASFSRSSNQLARKNPSYFQSHDEHYISDSRVLTLRQPLFRMYQWAQYKQSKFRVLAAESELEKDLQNLASQVAGAYFEALLADDNLALILAQKDLYSMRLDVARKGFAAGMGTRTDIDDAQARLDMGLALELEARQNQEYTHNQLQIMINNPIDALAGLDLNKMPLLPPDPPNVEAWRGLAEEHSPEYQSLKSQSDVAVAALDMARAGHYPTIDAIAQYSRSSSESINTINADYGTNSIGIQIALPIFSAGSINSSIRQAKLILENSNQTLEAKRREIGLQVQKEFRNVTEGIQKIRALEQAERSAVQMVLSNRKSFQAGTRTRQDILNAEQQRMAVLADLARQRYIYLLSRVRLFALTGQITLARIEEINGWLLRSNDNANPPYSAKMLEVNNSDEHPVNNEAEKK